MALSFHKVDGVMAVIFLTASNKVKACAWNLFAKTRLPWSASPSTICIILSSVLSCEIRTRMKIPRLKCLDWQQEEQVATCRCIMRASAGGPYLRGLQVGGTPLRSSQAEFLHSFQRAARDRGAGTVHRTVLRTLRTFCLFRVLFRADLGNLGPT